MIAADRAAAVLRRLPKVELHLHLEGSVRPALLSRLAGGSRAERSGVRALYRFDDFAGFLQVYARICRRLRRPEQWRDVVIDLGRRLRRQKVLHAEVFFSAAVHMRHGISYVELVAALDDGARCVAASGGPSLLFLADGVRQWGVRNFRAMVATVVRDASPRVVGVGLGGDEQALPASRFAAAVSQARAVGLASIVHSGEFGGPEAIRETLRSLHPHRLAHGVRAVEDAALLDELVRRRVCLDICLSSNRSTGATPSPGGSPLARLLSRGVRVSLGTDDPALFRCTLSGEYARAARLGVRPSGLVKLAVEGARASLLPAAERRSLIRVVRRAWTAAARRGHLGATR